MRGLRLRRSALAVLVTANLLTFVAAYAATHLGRGSDVSRPAARGRLGAQMQDVVIRSAGLKLRGWYAARPGARGVAALFHGYGDDRTGMVRAARAFIQLGFSVLLVDFSGAGVSDGRSTTIGFREAADVTATLREARRLEPGLPVIAYGVSMGAAAVLKSAADGGGGADALVLECPFNRLLDTVEHRFQRVSVPAFPLAHLLLFWGGVQQGFDPFAHNPATYARHVKTPTLLMAADGDPFVTVADTREVFGNLQGPRVLHLCQAQGHTTCLSVNAEHWMQSVDGFLRPVTARAAIAQELREGSSHADSAFPR